MGVFEPGQKIVLASNNPGKLAEIRDLLEPLGLTLVLQDALGIDPAEETANTFADNALLKARHASRQAGLPAIADDSGLEVLALNGAPGVYSARYAGPAASDADNNAKLLAALADTPAALRGARFHCVACAVRNAEDPEPVVCHGNWEGVILCEPRGSNGFGYDPLFKPADQDKTSAELDASAKNRMSHRARAFAELTRALRQD